MRDQNKEAVEKEHIAAEIYIPYNQLDLALLSLP